MTIAATRSIGLVAALGLMAGPALFGGRPLPFRQIEGAVLAAPDSLRAAATVLASNGQELRKGTNDLICLANDPASDRFQVACYHKSLEAFMARGRELKAAKAKREQVDSIRLAEVRAGKWAMPKDPATLYNYVAPKDSLDASTGLPRGGARWYVVYIPYATEATSGLSTLPDDTGRPWLMYPGQPWAHIMITPR